MNLLKLPFDIAKIQGNPGGGGGQRLDGAKSTQEAKGTTVELRTINEAAYTGVLISP